MILQNSYEDTCNGDNFCIIKKYVHRKRFSINFAEFFKKAFYRNRWTFISDNHKFPDLFLSILILKEYLVDVLKSDSDVPKNRVIYFIENPLKMMKNALISS